MRFFNQMGDVGEDYIDDGFTFGVDLLAQSHRASWFLTTSSDPKDLLGRGYVVTPNVMYNYWDDFEFMEFLKKENWSYYFKIHFYSRENRNLYTGFINPFMNRISKLNSEFKIAEIDVSGDKLEKLEDIPLWVEKKGVQYLKNTSIVLSINPF